MNHIELNEIFDDLIEWVMPTEILGIDEKVGGIKTNCPTIINSNNIIYSKYLVFTIAYNKS